ncbi:MAG: LOG family protein [Mariprofundus sp.]
MTLNLQRPRLAAFGASRADAQSAQYRDVQKLAQRIAEAGWNGITGGHEGMMAAFSRGIQAGGGHIRGITLECFPTPPDNSFSEEIRAADFFARLSHMIERADGWLVLPGGLGTLAELAMTWDLLAIRVLEPRPLLLYGEMWEPVVEVLNAQLIMSTKRAFDSIQICHSHTQVLQALAAAHAK